MALITRRNTLPGFEDSPFRSFEDSLNRLFSDLPAGRPWSPAVDILETENELVLTADLPGVPMENIDIRIEDGTLAVCGERKFESSEDKNSGYHRLERSYGSFKRIFTLPDTVDTEKVTADYKDGVLKVVLPKKEIAKPKSVKIALGK